MGSEQSKKMSDLLAEEKTFLLCRKRREKALSEGARPSGFAEAEGVPRTWQFQC